MINRKSVLTACAVVVAGLLMAVSAQARNNRTHLTFAKAVALPGVVLPAGSYTFELAPPSGALDVVRVASRDGQRVVYAGFTNLVSRPAGLPPDRAVLFGDAPAGQPAPITAWFRAGSAIGHQFLYQ